MSCRSANAAYQSEYRRLKAQSAKLLGSTLSPVEAWSLIRTLKAEQFPVKHIADLAGWKDRRLPHSLRVYDVPDDETAQAVRLGTLITLRTLLRVRRAYRLSLRDTSS